VPKQTNITVSYRIGINRSLGAGTFSSAKLELEESEVWDVNDVDDEVAVDLLASSVYDRLRSKLDARVEAQDKEWRGGA
jgi:hypothetical protein